MMAPSRQRRLLATVHLAVLFGLLASCGDQPPPQTTAQRVSETLARVQAEERQRAEEDKRNAPFDSSLNIDSLGTDDKIQLCGEDYRRIAVGWPIKKALACAGQDMYLTSDSAGGFRIWQHCDTRGSCLTIGERDGYVATWNR